MDYNAIATGGALAAGALVRQNGTVSGTSDLPQVVAAASGEYASGIVIDGAADGAQVRVCMFSSLFKVA
jgi:hypothetical protein